MVAQLAQKQLTPAASAEVERLLAVQGAHRLAHIAMWADDLRGSDPALFKRTSRLHFVKFHSADCRYDPPRDCPHGECAVAAIGRYAAILGDRSRTDAERAQALDFVVHLVGDLHQPLHASSGDDAGGNDFQVRWHGHGTNLHAVWDSRMLNARGLSYSAYADLLASDTRAVPQLDPVQWAEESCRIALGAYPSTRTITPAYIERERPIEEERLRAAGARLATLLNQELQ